MCLPISYLTTNIGFIPSSILLAFLAGHVGTLNKDYNSQSTWQISYGTVTMLVEWHEIRM